MNTSDKPRFTDTELEMATQLAFDATRSPTYNAQLLAELERRAFQAPKGEEQAKAWKRFFAFGRLCVGAEERIPDDHRLTPEMFLAIDAMVED